MSSHPPSPRYKMVHFQLTWRTGSKSYRAYVSSWRASPSHNSQPGAEVMWEDKQDTSKALCDDNMKGSQGCGVLRGSGLVFGHCQDIGREPM